jgi:hypothetical protein
MQHAYMQWRQPGPGNIWPIALVFWFLVIVLFVSLARIGTSLSERIWRRTP